MLEVYLLRHGETAYNAQGNKYCGRTDIGLTEKGLQQAQAVREQLAGVQFDAIFSSPLQRAYRTAQTASGQPDAVQIEPRLIEADFGSWEGKTKEEFIPENPGLWQDWSNDPGNTRAGGTGETALELVSRIDAFFLELVQRFPDGRVMVVAHNGANRLFMAYKLGMPLKNYRKIVQENSSVTLLEIDSAGELTLKKLNSKI
ncbi:histidine phosphatase family protein [Pedobacter yulinensis]|uniref:Histidine phosphatase family protein n=1 Tax=Pedobacter yulinensis TaxID=2126353 RepID=A0A2T3HQC1_9SPHI|nr:histidine phosphatase family protein [Pedobacter yulinensis]PST84660.1 histidine phosphatase family protein [Pedobacter yulinensis]